MVGHMGHLSGTVKILKVVGDRQILVRAYWQHRTRKTDKTPVSVRVPILLLLRGMATAGVKAISGTSTNTRRPRDRTRSASLA